MFPRTDLAVKSWRRITGWSPLYAPAAPSRRLKVVVDADTVEPNELLEHMLTRDPVTWWRYSEAGPDESVAVAIEEGLPFAIDWLIRVNDEQLGNAVTVVKDDGAHHIVGFGETGGALDRDFLPLLPGERERLGLHPASTEGEACDSMLKDVEVLRIADAVGADLLVTQRPYLLAKDRRLFRAEVCTPTSSDDSVPILGLYLRFSKIYVTYVQGVMYGTASRVGWYREGAAQAVPHLPLWIGYLHSNATDYSGGILPYLALAVEERLAKFLRSRDEMHLALSAPPTDVAIEDAIESLMSMAVAAQSALDASARALSDVLEMQLEPFQCAFHRRGFREKLQEVASKGSESVAHRVLRWMYTYDESGEYSTHPALTLIWGLRNMIHDLGPQGAQVIPVDNRPQQRNVAMILPPHRSSDVVEAAEDLGGSRRIGFHVMNTGRVAVEPYLVTERLTPCFMQLMDGLCARMVPDGWDPAARSLPHRYSRKFPPSDAILGQLVIGDCTYGALAETN